MVTEPEPGFVSLVDRLEEVKHFLMTEWELAADDGWSSRAGHIADLLATLGDAIEALQMEDGSSQGLKPAVSGGREDAPTEERYGCYVDLIEGEEPDGCVIEYSAHEDCLYAKFPNGRRRRSPKTCKYWQPLPAPPTEEPKT